MNIKTGAAVVALSIFAMPLMAQGQETNPQNMLEANEICVLNSSEKEHFFAVEIINGEREVKALSVGEKLCIIAADNSSSGVVSVFEKKDDQEGCSRLVKLGTAEEMFKYAEADRCLWTSNS